MKLVVGLGNPGKKYADTRHNVGFEVVDRLKKGLRVKEVRFLKPQLFMNRSGEVVKEALKKNKVKFEDLYVVHDDLDIELGEFKISWGKGPKDHNGLRSIYEELSSKEFWHVRVGIDNRVEIPFEGSGEEYVLSLWLSEERLVVNNVVSQVVKELKDVFA